MFIVKMILRNIKKHWKKSLLSIGISGLIVLFVSVYIQNMESNRMRLELLGTTIPVTGRVTNIDGSQEIGLKIDFEYLKKMQESGFTIDEVMTIQTYGEGADLPEEEKPQRPTWFNTSTNSLSAFNSFSAKDVTFLPPYNEDIFSGKEAVCILRDQFMEEQGLKLGDEWELILHAPMYDGGGMENFKYKKLGYIKLKVAGSYYNRWKGPSDDLPGIITPLDFIVGVYEDAGLQCFASSARFALKEPLRINEFKERMLEIGFKSADVRKEYSRNGRAITMNDETFIRAATQLTKSLDMLRALAPILFIIIAVIGFIASYLLLQSRQYEFAIMRSLGTGKGRSFLILILESAVLSVAGCLLGALGNGVLLGTKPVVILLISLLFLAFYLSGTVIALFLLNRFNVMVILSKTD